MFSIFNYSKHLSLPNSYTKVPPEDPRDEFQRRKETFAGNQKWKRAFWATIILALVEGFLLGYQQFVPRGSVYLLKTSIPQIGYEIRSFQGDPRFENLKTESEVDAAWDSFIKPHAGFIHVENPRKFGLVPNKNVVETENSYMVSFYHQLHCLKEIQAHYVNFVTSVEDGGSEREMYMMTESAKRHAEHCFDYIRQGIQCSGDIALEGPDLVREPLESPLRGWGVKHQCRKWDALVEWMEENEAT